MQGRRFPSTSPRSATSFSSVGLRRCTNRADLAYILQVFEDFVASPDEENTGPFLLLAFDYPETNWEPLVAMLREFPGMEIQPDNRGWDTLLGWVKEWRIFIDSGTVTLTIFRYGPSTLFLFIEECVSMEATEEIFSHIESKILQPAPSTHLKLFLAELNRRGSPYSWICALSGLSFTSEITKIIRSRLFTASWEVVLRSDSVDILSDEMLSTMVPFGSDHLNLRKNQPKNVR